jgi:hypothetical protein
VGGIWPTEVRMLVRYLGGAVGPSGPERELPLPRGTGAPRGCDQAPTPQGRPRRCYSSRAAGGPDTTSPPARIGLHSTLRKQASSKEPSAESLSSFSASAIWLELVGNKSLAVWTPSTPQRSPSHALCLPRGSEHLLGSQISWPKIDPRGSDRL